MVLKAFCVPLAFEMFEWTYIALEQSYLVSKPTFCFIILLNENPILYLKKQKEIGFRFIIEIQRVSNHPCTFLSRKRCVGFFWEKSLLPSKHY